MKSRNQLLPLLRNLGLSLFFLALPQVGHADSVPATVTSIQGAVTATDAAGKPVQIVQGSKLPVGDTIKTGPNGTVGLTLVPGAGTVVKPNTEVKISALDFNKGADGSNNRKIQLNLKNGTLISTLFKKDGHSDFQVATPYGVAAAKGTSWAVVLNGTTLTIQVANGVVSVKNAAGQTVASVSGGQGYDSATGAITALPQSVIDSITTALSEALPNLTTAAIQALLNNATINPATANSHTNSPNK